jgi:hypothetical protein
VTLTGDILTTATPALTVPERGMSVILPIPGSFPCKQLFLQFQ